MKEACNNRLNGINTANSMRFKNHKTLDLPDTKVLHLTQFKDKDSIPYSTGLHCITDFIENGWIIDGGWNRYLCGCCQLTDGFA